MDDEPEILKIASKMLALSGYDVVTAINGVKAYNLFKEAYESDYTKIVLNKKNALTN